MATPRKKGAIHIPKLIKDGDRAWMRRAEAMKRTGKGRDLKDAPERAAEAAKGKITSLRPLTPRQQAFAEEYAKDLNGARAMVAAGYSPKDAKRPTRLLQDPAVQAAIQQAKVDLARKAGISRKNVLAETAAIAFSDIRKLFDADGNLLSVRDWPNDIAPAVAGIEVMVMAGKDGQAQTLKVAKIKLWDKNAALEKLLRHLGLESGEASPIEQLMAAIAAHPNGGRFLPAPS